MIAIKKINDEKTCIISTDPKKFLTDSIIVISVIDLKFELQI